jgi:TonB-linked SusC/RagA family outer membrane protein
MLKQIPTFYKFFLLLAFVFLAQFKVIAQGSGTITIKGKVTESPAGSTLAGVTVVELNENNRQINGGVSDVDGNYTIRISNAKNQLRFSFIGFVTQTLAINGKSVINVTLKPSPNSQLEDVVITAKKEDVIQNGFGTTNSRDIIGAVTHIKAEVMAEQPATSIDQMLQGRAAGVQVVNTSGDPGAGVDIRIRGAGSLSGGNSPLYVVDGVPIISTPYENTQGFDPTKISTSQVAQINPIADINPSDIESIDILKDANATAIYGARAANGVIIITTKRGSKGTTNITFNTQLGMQESPRGIPVLDGPSYKVMRLEGEQNRNNINPNNADNQLLVDDPTIPNYQYYQNNTNWLKQIQQTGFSQMYNLSVNGGGETMRYSFSTSFTDRKGAFVNTGNTRFTGRFNLDYQVSDKLRFGSNVSFARSKVNNYANYGFGSPYYNSLLRSPAMPVYDIDANGNVLSSYASLPGFHATQDNPVAQAVLVTNDAFSTNLKPNVYGELDIIKGLKFRSNASLDFVGEKGLLFLPPEATGELVTNQNFNRLDTREFERMQMIVDNLLSYSTRFGKASKFNFLLGNTFNKFNSNELRIFSNATASDKLQVLNAAANIRQLKSIKQTETIISVFAKADFILNDKYGFNFTIRRDGSSKFGDGNKYGNFPSVGGYWRASSEPFLKNIAQLSNMKFRLSWGQNGNSGIPNYAFISTFAAGDNYAGDNGVSLRSPGLTNLRWETNETTNLGIDLELFNSRLVITNDWYIRTTKDLLYRYTIPSSSGLETSSGSTANPTVLGNLGNIQNKGFELDISYEAIRAKKAGAFKWNVGFNIGINRNKVTKLPGGTITTPDATFRNFTSQVKEGDALGTYYGYVFKGVYATDLAAAVKDKNGKTVYELDGVTPRIMRINSETGDTFKGGDAIFEDFNHDGIIDEQDRVKIGNANPDFFGGFNNSFDYKNFGVRLFVQFQYGNDVINGMRYDLESMQFTLNAATSVLNRWRKQGDITNMPRALRNDGRNNVASTRWVEDGSYARLKYITFSYKCPRPLISRTGLKDVSMFVTLSNLFTWTKYTGADPEIGLGDSPTFIGVDKGLTPQSKMYTMGINIKF